MPVTVRNTDILFNDNTTQSTAAGGAPVVSAGTNWWMSGGSASFNGAPTSYTRGIWVKMVVSGTVRVEWAMRGNEYNSYTVFGRVYKNGVAVGAERSKNGNLGINYYTDDISVSPGDRIEIWGRSSSNNFAVNLTGINIGTSTNTVIPATGTTDTNTLGGFSL
jgi:hypothetical protein